MKKEKSKAMQLKTPIGRLRLLAILEGISYLLLGITMPLKYMMEIPTPNFIVGMGHGWLFIAYIIISLQNAYIHKWSIQTTILVLVASLIPVGTFVIDAKILKPLSVSKQRLSDS
jgi:integral membrane protein